MDPNREPSKEQVARVMQTDLVRLKTIEEQIPRSVRGQNWHRQRVDNLKRRVDDAARRLDL